MPVLGTSEGIIGRTNVALELLRTSLEGEALDVKSGLLLEFHTNSLPGRALGRVSAKELAFI
jgi:hypothetical protein